MSCNSSKMTSCSGVRGESVIVVSFCVLSFGLTTAIALSISNCSFGIEPLAHHSITGTIISSGLESSF